jgi:hypothetical protein
MRFSYSLAVLSILAVLLVGCTGGGAKKVDLTSPFIGGTQGVVFGFQDLRADVFDSGRDAFDVVVKLENKGEALIPMENARVKLSGINPAEFGKSQSDLSKSPSDDVLQMSKDPQGAILIPPPVFVEFPGLNYKKSIVGAAAPFTLRAEVCYLYRTKAVSKLCVRENLLSPQAGGICEVSGDKPLFVSGAPVQLMNFKQSAGAKDKVRFQFDVVNRGQGLVYERNSACDSADTRKENRVYIIVETSIPGLSCTGLESTERGAEGFATLYSGSKTVTCTQTVAERSDYEQLVNIEAVYDYEELVQTQITVKSSGE